MLKEYRIGFYLMAALVSALAVYNIKLSHRLNDVSAMLQPVQGQQEKNEIFVPTPCLRAHTDDLEAGDTVPKHDHKINLPSNLVVAQEVLGGIALRMLGAKKPFLTLDGDAPTTTTMSITDYLRREKAFEIELLKELKALQAKEGE